nr:MAG TPA: major capsid protein [Caudoviricetes sp.]
MAKVTKKDVLGSLENLSSEERAFMEKNASIVCEIVNKATDGLLSSEEVERKFNALQEALNKSVADNETLSKANEDLCEQVKNLAETIDKAKKQGVNPLMSSKFIDKFEAMMDSTKMKNFSDGVEKASGWFDGFSVKDISNISSVENNYTGDILLSRQSNVLTNPFMPPKTSVRDIIRTIPGDPQHPSFTYLRVKNFDRNARYTTENGRLSQSNLEYEEVTTSIRRVGSYFDLSKNLLLARVQLRSFLVASIPGIITQAENASILFGDGQKSHLLGIANIDGVESIESQITAEIVSGKAGEVVKVEKYNNGNDCLVEFKVPISKALSTQMVTFTGASVNTDLNSAHPFIKINDRQVIVRGAAYKGEETALASMTFKINHASFKSVEVPNSKDVISAILACLSFAQYTPNAIMLNPLTLFAIETEKDSLGRSLDIVQINGGRKTISGLPVIECHDVPVGRYLVGDFQNGANLYDYTNLEMQWVEDAETVLYNMVRLVFQEQLALVVYMPWAFAEGSLEELRKAITKEVTPATKPDDSSKG